MSRYQGDLGAPAYTAAPQQPRYGSVQQYPQQQQQRFDYGNGQQQAYNSSMPQGRMYQQQFNGALQQAAVQHSSTPNSRPAKRMRSADGTAQQPQQLHQQQQYYHQQYQQPQQQWQQLPQQHQQQQYMQQPPPPPRLPPQQQQQQQQQLQPQQGPYNASIQQSNNSSSSRSTPPSQYPCSNSNNPAAAAWLDALQDEILRFTQQVVPSPQEQQIRDACVSAFANITAQALPEYAHMLKVSLFGSGAAGLALHTSDLDVVIAGLASPDEFNKGHFDDCDKQLIVACLRRLERAAMYGPGRQQLGVVSSRLIGRARIPVLKLVLCCGLELDVSFNNDGGIKAASFLKSFQNDYRALQPLTLLLKCVLKQRGLSEVYMGGLGSWSLVNMIIAHLMEEDKAGGEADHLGAMLLSFLQRYGVSFDRNRRAVAVRRGGIVNKNILGPNFGQVGKLLLEDPLTGLEVAGGSHRYADVESTFRRLAERLSDALTPAAAPKQQQQESGSSAASQQQQQRCGDGSSSHLVFNDDGEEFGYDAGNRSPTYRARIRQSRSKSAESNRSNFDFDLLELLLDSEEALQRRASEEPAAAVGGADAGRQGQGGGGGGAGQWQWGNGGSRDGATGGASRKRDRWG